MSDDDDEMRASACVRRAAAAAATVNFHCVCNSTTLTEQFEFQIVALTVYVFEYMRG